MKKVVIRRFEKMAHFDFKAQYIVYLYTIDKVMQSESGYTYDGARCGQLEEYDQRLSNRMHSDQGVEQT